MSYHFFKPSVHCLLLALNENIIRILKIAVWCHGSHIHMHSHSRITGMLHKLMQLLLVYFLYMPILLVFGHLESTNRYGMAVLSLGLL